jgi:predicted nucleic acid-binding protein
MVDVPAFIIDASVAVKWILQLADEPFVDIASSILDDYQAHRIRLFAPAVINYEIGDALLRAVRRGRVTSTQARAGLEGFYDLRVPKTSSRRLLARGWDISTLYGCSFYDGAYLALAELTATPFLYADERLRNVLADRFSPALWITDYHPAQP